jgi:hypothetical protein
MNNTRDLTSSDRPICTSVVNLGTGDSPVHYCTTTDVPWIVVAIILFVF